MCNLTKLLQLSNSLNMNLIKTTLEFELTALTIGILQILVSKKKSINVTNVHHVAGQVLMVKMA